MWETCTSVEVGGLKGWGGETLLGRKAGAAEKWHALSCGTVKGCRGSESVTRPDEASITRHDEWQCEAGMWSGRSCAPGQGPLQSQHL